MLPPAHQDRIILDARVDDADAIVEIVCNPGWVREATLIKDDKRASVIRGEVGGEQVIVRTSRLDRAKDTPARWFGRTRLLRAWRGGNVLERAGIPTPSRLLIFRGRRDGVWIETMVTRAAAGRSLMAFVDDASPAALRTCAATLGQHIERMVDAGIFHRDHKASNLFVDDDGTIIIVDTDGVRRSRRPDARDRMLMSSVIELMGVGRAPDRDVCVRVVQASGTDDWRATWRRVAAMIEAHGDPRPSDDPRAYDDRASDQQ